MTTWQSTWETTDMQGIISWMDAQIALNPSGFEVSGTMADGFTTESGTTLTSAQAAAVPIDTLAAITLLFIDMGAYGYSSITGSDDPTAAFMSWAGVNGTGKGYDAYDEVLTSVLYSTFGTDSEYVANDISLFMTNDYAAGTETTDEKNFASTLTLYTDDTEGYYAANPTAATGGMALNIGTSDDPNYIYLTEAEILADGEGVWNSYVVASE